MRLRLPSTQEPCMGLLKVNPQASQWFSRVAIAFKGASEWIYPLQLSGVAVAALEPVAISFSAKYRGYSKLRTRTALGSYVY